jgi:hypothetical protein
MKKESITVNRNELYEQVWSEPVSRLAPKYGISDVGLKKICKKLNVPTPPLGYWTKIQHNIRVEKTPLPRFKRGQPQIHTISGYQDLTSEQIRQNTGILFKSDMDSALGSLKEHTAFKSPKRLPIDHLIAVP